MSDTVLNVGMGVVAVVVAALASSHAVMNKRDVRAAAGWAGLIWLAPIVGAALYTLLGVNRIKRSAIALRSGARHVDVDVSVQPVEPAELVTHLGGDCRHLDELARLVGRVTERALVGGNVVHLLVDGDDAYERMLEAISTAERSIVLVTYIFDNDPIGARFTRALGDAVARGVEVRVLIDAAGVRYTSPPADRELRRAGVKTALFMPLRTFRLRYFNLRNHRKLMIVDGARAFTGGMNIRHGHALKESPAHPIQDVHFEVRGPVVTQLREVFADDWAFAASELLTGPTWTADVETPGNVCCRAIVDGPDEDLDKCRWTLLGALGCARERVTIVTPYFLPDDALITALSVAALRGVQVDILIPERGNLRLVEWACWAQLALLLQRGCRIWLTPPPFDHSKLMVVDDVWLLCGSANWDPRSLRLNFELNLECYDRGLVERVAVLAEDKRARSRRLTPHDLSSLSLPARLRNSVARLLMPYL